MPHWPTPLHGAAWRGGSYIWSEPTFTVLPVRRRLARRPPDGPTCFQPLNYETSLTRRVSGARLDARAQAYKVSAWLQAASNGGAHIPAFRGLCEYRLRYPSSSTPWRSINIYKIVHLRRRHPLRVSGSPGGSPCLRYASPSPGRFLCGRPFHAHSNVRTTVGR